MERRKYKIRPVNRLFIIWLFIILVVFAVITCSSSYIVQKENIMRQCEAVLQEVYDLYDEKISSFSEIYVPIYASEDNEKMIRSYFSRRGESIPDATERARLVSLLGEMIRQDEAVSFIALYNPNAVHNYSFIVNGNSLKDFWPGILPEIDESGDRMQLLGRYEWKDDNGNTRNAFMVKGGALVGNDGGCIIVGYNADIFDQIIRQDTSDNLAAFIITNENGVIYDSEGKRYVEDFQTEWLEEGSAYHIGPDSRVWFTGVIRNKCRGLTAAYIMPWWQIVKKSNGVTWLLLLVLVFFSFFALALYLFSSRQIFLKVRQIQKGLIMIGDNKLDYRLQVTDLNDEFDEIANNINAMTGRLKEGIEREYQMRLQQNRAELNQIQARFNPHFLYNTLEIIRGNLFQNGDLENADYIEKLSRIFRNITDASSVLSIREEISFCGIYMALLQLRFHDAVDTTYAIDAELQECGILAHLIQPAIENYFVHALSEAEEYHTMDIICERYDENSIRFIIADNGTGLSRERLEEINLQLRSLENCGKGYGLDSIANRIRLFYGEEYGVMLDQNQPNGIKVIITIPKMSVDEHQRRLGIIESD